MMSYARPERRGPYDPWSDLRRSKTDSIGEMIRDARIAANKTQQQLADELEIGRSRLSQWESEIRVIPYGEMFNVVRVLGLDLDAAKEARGRTMYPGLH